jgi:hypothetical protein
MEQVFTLRMTLIALVSLCASCSNFSDQHDQQKLQFEQLANAMNQCLENQASNRQDMVRYQQQLGEVTGTLAEIQEHNSRKAPEEITLPPTPTPTAVASCPPPAFTDDHTKILVGQREQVWLQDLKLSLPARIDTGAETASLDAHNIELFERNSRNWVRFDIVHPETGEPLQLERKLKRHALILQANSSEPERRPVIKLGITIGSVSQTAEFTLSNRSHLDYQILVGRNILKDVMVVDVSQDNLAPHAGIATEAPNSP